MYYQIHDGWGGGGGGGGGGGLGAVKVVQNGFII